MSKEKKYPKVIAGAFIINDNNELLLKKSSSQKNKYTCVNSKVEDGEAYQDTLKRIVKEKTNLELVNIKLIDIVNGLNIKTDEGKVNFIFIDCKVSVKEIEKFKVDEEKVFEWLKLEEWLSKDEKEFGPYILDSIKKIKESESEESFEHQYKRALADYQNLLRRTQQERLKSIQLANQGLMEDLIQPLEHLEMAAQQIDDQGLNMVTGQLKRVLEDAGLKEIEAMDKKFDVDFMEAVEKGDKGDKVIKIVRKGYLLNGEVIQHAKVVLD